MVATPLRLIDGECRSSIIKRLETMDRITTSHTQHCTSPGSPIMSRQLMLSALLSVAMMATFALGSQAYAGAVAAEEYAECDGDEINANPLGNGPDMPARLVLASL